MDRLDDEDIGIIWARHYPKRAEQRILDVVVRDPHHDHKAAR